MRVDWNDVAWIGLCCSILCDPVAHRDHAARESAGICGQCKREPRGSGRGKVGTDASPRVGRAEAYDPRMEAFAMMRGPWQQIRDLGDLGLILAALALAFLVLFTALGCTPPPEVLGGG